MLLGIFFLGFLRGFFFQLLLINYTILFGIFLFQNLQNIKIYLQKNVCKNFKMYLLSIVLNSEMILKEFKIIGTIQNNVARRQ